MLSWPIATAMRQTFIVMAALIVCGAATYPRDFEELP